MSGRTAGSEMLGIFCLRNTAVSSGEWWENLSLGWDWNFHTHVFRLEIAGIHLRGGGEFGDGKKPKCLSLYGLYE